MITLTDLYDLATKHQHAAIVAWIYPSGSYSQTARDMDVSFDKFMKTSPVAWARESKKLYDLVPGSALSIRRKAILRAANAIEIYLIARDQSIESALLYKLARPC